MLDRVSRARLSSLVLISVSFAVFPVDAQELDLAREVSCESLFGGTASTPKDVPPQADDATDETLNAAVLQDPSADELAALPAKVFFRDPSADSNLLYDFAILNGQLFVRSRGAENAWKKRTLPPCLDGYIEAISVDDEEIIAVDDQRRVFTMDYALNEPWVFNWTRRWGPFFWANLGVSLPEDTAAWSLSNLTAAADGGFTDDAGNFHTSGGVTTVAILRDDRQRITYLDPWLPNDYSYEICGPDRGTLRLASISASGSTSFVAGMDGSLWTRLYDFDISGANTIFVVYNYEDQRGAAAPEVQLPAPQWVRQPPPPGLYTDRISIEKGAISDPASQPALRRLRVEGKRGSEAGYWEKDWKDLDWTFTATGDALVGSPLPRADEEPFGRAEDLLFAGAVDDIGLSFEIPDFNPYCTPATLRVTADGQSVDLILHSVDGLRQESRSRGLDAVPHEYRAAIETPKSVSTSIETLPPALKAFLSVTLQSKTFQTAVLDVTAEQLSFGVSAEGGCYSLSRVYNGVESPADPPPSRLSGDPVSPRPILPEDLGADVAGLRSSWEDERTAWRCMPTPLGNDSDNDGVNNSADHCAETPAGAAVDSDGCSDSQMNGDNPPRSRAVAPQGTAGGGMDWALLAVLFLFMGGSALSYPGRKRS